MLSEENNKLIDEMITGYKHRLSKHVCELKELEKQAEYAKGKINILDYAIAELEELKENLNLPDTES